MKTREFVDIVAGLCNDILLKKKQPPLPDLSVKDWDRLLTFASMQGVLPVIAPLFTDFETEDMQLRVMLVEWYGSSQECHQGYQLRIYNMRELAKIFAEEGIDIMFMKGAALAQLYPNPKWRVFSDIDFYLFGDFERGLWVMSKHGIRNSEYPHHHTQASLNGILLENHYDFVERANHRCDLILDDALKALAKKEGKSIPVTFLGGDIRNAYVMTPTMNAVFLMRHTSAHFVSETIPLRMLYDWALFLGQQGQDVDWPLVTGLYTQSGMTRFAGIVQQILRTHLEYECKDCPIAPGTQEDAEKVWESIIYPPEQDPYKGGTLHYYLFETRTFFANRWKHKIVYPGESFTLLFLKYVWFGIRRMTGTLNIEH